MKPYIIIASRNKIVISFCKLKSVIQDTCNIIQSLNLKNEDNN